MKALVGSNDISRVEYGGAKTYLVKGNSLCIMDGEVHVREGEIIN